jgi:anti-sigma factor RsiW
MDEHPRGEISALLSGEAGRADVLAVSAHLRDCDDCRQELITSTTGHVALTSALRFAAEIVRTEPGSENRAQTKPDCPPATNDEV